MLLLLVLAGNFARFLVTRSY